MMWSKHSRRTHVSFAISERGSVDAYEMIEYHCFVSVHIAERSPQLPEPGHVIDQQASSARNLRKPSALGSSMLSPCDGDQERPNEDLHSSC
jgi:hypothetical protein